MGCFWAKTKHSVGCVESVEAHGVTFLGTVRQRGQGVALGNSPHRWRGLEERWRHEVLDLVVRYDPLIGAVHVGRLRNDFLLERCCIVGFGGVGVGLLVNIFCQGPSQDQDRQTNTSATCMRGIESEQGRFIDADARSNHPSFSSEGKSHAFSPLPRRQPTECLLLVAVSALSLDPLKNRGGLGATEMIQSVMIDSHQASIFVAPRIKD